MSATDKCLQCDQVWGFPNYFVHYFQEQENWRMSSRNLKRWLKVICVSRYMQPRTKGKPVLHILISCIRCHILFSVLDKHKWFSNKHRELLHTSFPALPLFFPLSLLPFFLSHHIPATCPHFQAHQALLVLNLTQNRDSISLLLLISIAWSPSTITLNIHFFMCPFRSVTGSPKTSTKPFILFFPGACFFLGSEVQTVSGR